MIDALLYLQGQSLKNRLLARIRRLRRPKYLFGAIFGFGYLSLVVLRPFLMASRDTRSLAMPKEFAGVWEFAAAAALLVGALLVWVLPQDRTGLVFSEAEIAFLFPAPVRRITLVHFKLLKAQTSILFTAAFFAVLSIQGIGLAGAGERVVGVWLLLSIMSLHLLGASFARTLLLGRGVSNWMRRGVVLALAVALLGGAVWWAREEMPTLQTADVQSRDTLARYFHAVADATPSRVLLAPFRAVVAPLFAADGAAFLRALGPAAALLALHYLWVVRSDVAFEEASLDASRRHASLMAAARGGNRWGAGRPRRRARPPFALAPTGSPAIALLWKNLLSAGPLFSLRVWLPITAWGLFMGYLFNHHASGSMWPHVIGTGAILLAGASILVGPQIVRQDFRQDLPAIDLLKTYPMSGRQVAAGQLLSPVAILTACQWLLLGLAALLFDGAEIARAGLPSGPTELAGCLALLAPPLNLITLLIPNAAALLYPGWFQATPGASRGIETMGQRLMFLVALIALMALTIAPAAGAFGLVYLVGAPWLLPDGMALPAATLSAAVVLALEGGVGVIGVGRLFERFDPSAETA